MYTPKKKRNSTSLCSFKWQVLLHLCSKLEWEFCDFSFVTLILWSWNSVLTFTIRMTNYSLAEFIFCCYSNGMSEEKRILFIITFLCRPLVCDTSLWNYPYVSLGVFKEDWSSLLHKKGLYPRCCSCFGNLNLVPKILFEIKSVAFLSRLFKYFLRCGTS